MRIKKDASKYLEVFHLQTVIVYEVNVFISKYLATTNNIVLGNA